MFLIKKAKKKIITINVLSLDERRGACSDNPAQ